MSQMKKAAIYTLGCKANQYESEAISEGLTEKGFEIVTNGADVAVVNTCTVTAEADRKCRQTIRRAAKENPGAALFVTGCMAQVDPKAAASIPGVVFVCGNLKKMRSRGEIGGSQMPRLPPARPPGTDGYLPPFACGCLAALAVCCLIACGGRQ